MNTSAQKSTSLTIAPRLQSQFPSPELGETALLLFEIGCLFLLLCVVMLLDNVMGGNEVDVLPLARQYAQPNWMPNDWYLNQPAGYRLLFQIVFGNLAKTSGFLATSALGRLFCYLSLSVGIVFIARKLGIQLLYLIFAIALNLGLHWYRGAMTSVESYFPGIFDQLFTRSIADTLFYGLIVLSLCLLAISFKTPKISRSLAWILLACGLFLAADNRPFSIVANEWYVGGLEAKAVSYALIFPAIALMLHSRYICMSALLGLAASFHVLAGGYAGIVVGAYLLLYKKREFVKGKRLILATLAYLLCAVFAILAVVNQLFSSVPSASLNPSFIYVFIRLPHHLNPAAWPSKWWISLVFYLSISVISLFLIQQASAKVNKLEGSTESQKSQVSATSCSELFKLAMIGMIPFFAGLLVAPFDRTGAYLQYYPFRFGDIFLPFSTCILFAAALQSTVARWRPYGRFPKRFTCFALTGLIVLFLAFETKELKKNVKATLNFPHLPAEKMELYKWISSNTWPAEKFITPPSSLEEFSWVSERSTVVNLKLFPQTKAGIIEWYDRLNDISGGTGRWAETALSAEGSVFGTVSEILVDSYQQLDTAQVEALLKKYQARYWVTPQPAGIDLPIAFENSSYIIYRSDNAHKSEFSRTGHPDSLRSINPS